MRIDIPKRTAFLQGNRGDVLGSLWSTKNVDLESNKGKLRVSPAMAHTITTDDNSLLSSPPSGFAYSGDFVTDRYFMVAGSRIWETSGDDPDDTFSVATGSVTDVDINSDIKSFNSAVYVATQGDLYKYNGTSWSSVMSLNANPHNLEVYANRLYVTDEFEKVKSLDASDTPATSGSNTLDVATVTGEGQIITKLMAASNGLWILTTFTNRAGGEVLFWDGEDENSPDQTYTLKRGALSGVIRNDRPYIMDSEGKLMAFDGVSFTELARLPFSVNEQGFQFNANSNERFIHPNGMTEVGDEMYINIANSREDSNAEADERRHGGVWAYNEEFGLYCKYTMHDTDESASSTTNCGSVDVRSVGAIFNTSAVGSNPVSLTSRSEFLAGVEFYSGPTTTKSAVAVTELDRSIPTSAQLITTQIQAEEFEETWKEIILLYDKLKSSDDEVVLKYRTSYDTPLYGTATWSDDLVLQTLTDVSDYGEYDEIEITRGDGAGCAYTIEEITGNYRIAIKNNNLSGMTGDVRFRMSKWRYLASSSELDTQLLRAEIAEAAQDIFIQVKVLLNGDITMHRLIVKSDPNKAYS